MIDTGFPHIIYNPSLSPFENGEKHGELFSKAIRELCGIRKNLMQERSPHLSKNIDRLANEQIEFTKEFDGKLFEELSGIAIGSNRPLSDIIILNNYTDFRDISLPDEGCSSISLNSTDRVSGQTWDMHSSAKNYVCVIENPGHWVAFSLVGCLGMMGANRESLFVGVNNINTIDAKSGIIWSAFVRKSLLLKSRSEVLALAEKTSFTGAHNYLISDMQGAQHQEISPTRNAMASIYENEGAIFHTNHCVNDEMKEIEEKLSLNSTSMERFNLLKASISNIHTQDELKAILQSHEGYPKSLCGHYQSGAQDPSITCGGGVFNHKTTEFLFWRGCPIEDSNYAEIKVKIK
ncbi:MAG: C45 family peptidase [Bacteriovoracaceae bacterium]|nr:C45 family peptidase [Bacteriovoracaceae bacterium]